MECQPGILFREGSSGSSGPNITAILGFRVQSSVRLEGSVSSAPRDKEPGETEQEARIRLQHKVKSPDRGFRKLVNGELDKFRHLSLIAQKSACTSYKHNDQSTNKQTWGWQERVTVNT
jgi:hypothetical protein